MSSNFEDIIKRAYTLASDKRHEFVTLEHVLYCLTEADDIQEIITAVGGDINKLRGLLKAYIDDPTNHILIKTGPYQPRHTSMLLHIVKKAKTQSLFSGRSDMGCVDLFLAMFNIDNSHASYFLNEAGVVKEVVIAYLSTNNKNTTQNSEKESLEVLEQYCQNLNEKAKAGKIDPLIGRETEVETITQILARRNKNNVIMLGDPGVGKTIIVEGLARRISEGDVPEILENTTIWSLDIASLVAGTKFRGDFEERMKQVIQAFASLPNAVMFIDEIHMIMGAGGGSSGAMDAANLLKPALSRGEIRCIGSTTTEEYRKHFEKDRALQRRFQRVDVDEPSIDDSKRILHAISTYYTQFHGIGYTTEALDAAVTLTARHIHNRFLPDKAIDLIDSAGARQKIKPLHERVETIGLKEITEELNRVARVAVNAEEADDTSKLYHLEPELKSTVFGQDEAINKLIDAVYISKSGLREGNKTLGAFLFTGPSGVGKTEIAKQLASVMGIEFIRFDMSEFQERHSVSKFIGSPPGYVGYADGASGSGVLINELERHPHSVILLDEIEKAHPDIVNIFLQVMDNGMISSQSGKTASARNTFIIFTSNLGAVAMEKSNIGFGAGERKDEGQEAVKNWFAPEFRNRLDAVIEFGRLSKESMSKILDKFIAQLNELSSQKKVNIVFDTRAKEWLIERGFDRNMGARPLSRVIQENVKKPLSREMLFGSLKQGGGVMFTVEEGKLHYTIIETAPESGNLLTTTLEGNVECLTQ
jgi:ATP-dependent Clp protease ATP-binding subunit ClpA